MQKEVGNNPEAQSERDSKINFIYFLYSQMRYSILTAICFVFVSIPFYAQSVDDSSLFENKNSVSISGGYGLLYITGHVSYERILKPRLDNDKFRQFGFKVGYNRWVFWADDGSTFYGALNWIWGKSKNHLETSLGLSILFESSSYEIGVSNSRVINGGSGVEPSRAEYTMLLPSGNIGYRFQKPDGNFIFRTGIGFPEAVYIGFGVAF